MGSWDALVKTHIVSIHKTLKKLKKEIVCDDNISNIVNEVETLISEDRTIENNKMVFRNEIGRLEGALNNYKSEKDPKFLKTEIRDKRKYLSKKVAYPYEYFNSIDDYQKTVNNSKKRTSLLNCKTIWDIMWKQKVLKNL